MPGIAVIVDERDIIYNNYSINNEKFGIYSKENIQMSDLKNIENLTLGLVKDDYNAQWILEFFRANEINIKTIIKETYDELVELLNRNEIHLMIDGVYNKNENNKIYEFSSKQVYIAGNKNSRNILNNIDKAIYDFQTKGKNEICLLRNKYFEENTRASSSEYITIFLITNAVFLILLIWLIFPIIKRKIIIDKIKDRMNREQYLLQYQPIYNPRSEEIIAFEGLLRLKGENEKLISPYEFIPEIENNNMLFDVSIWILKKVITDYKKIQKFQFMKERNFYISINISLKEIENDKFVEKVIEILSKSNLENNSICLEIVERVKMNDINKITRNIDLLKNAGFKIAIDDFGVEYSNLDILQKLDFDTIKVDKNFVDGIDKDIIRNEIIKFISTIAIVKNKSVVLEGVEELSQDIAIKKIENELLYVQGYYYNKPMYIEQIKYLQ